MYRQKTIINRQRRNISQIANVQRKVSQTDRSPCKHTVKYRQSSPCKHGKILDKYIDKIRTTKKSTKFTLQMQYNYRQSSTKVSSKFALQMQRYRQHTVYCAITTLYCAIGKLETFSSSNFIFPIPKDYKPLKY